MKRIKQTYVFKDDISYLRKVFPKEKGWSDSKRFNLAVGVFKNSGFLDKLRPEMSDTSQDRLLKKMFKGKLL